MLPSKQTSSIGERGKPQWSSGARIGQKWTADIYGGANLWKFGEQRDARH